MNFKDYITNIETLSQTLIEADGSVIFRLDIFAFGLSGDGGAQIYFPEIETSGDGELQPYAFINFPLIELLSNNAIWADAIFPVFEVEGQLAEPIAGNAYFPAFQVSGVGRSGNSGEYYFYVQVEGGGNANREYEPC